MFYVSGVILTLLMTCTQRTASARLPLFFLLAAGLILERLVVPHVISYALDINAEVRNVNIYVIIRARISRPYNKLTIILLSR